MFTQQIRELKLTYVEIYHVDRNHNINPILKPSKYPFLLVHRKKDKLWIVIIYLNVNMVIHIDVTPASSYNQDQQIAELVEIEYFINHWFDHGELWEGPSWWNIQVFDTFLYIIAHVIEFIQSKKFSDLPKEHSYYI